MKNTKGIVAPISYLRSCHDFGIGNIYDLKLLIDFCSLRQLRIIQLLPINDTGTLNLWPYSSISSYAINPVYIDLNGVRAKYQNLIDSKILKNIDNLIKVAEAEEYPNLINYPLIRQNTLNLLMHFFQALETNLYEEISKFKEQFPWVLDYALFLCISQKFGGSPWWEWPDLLKRHDGPTITNFYENNKSEVDFYIFTQMLTVSQFEALKVYANKNSVKLKGDIPILTSENSADIWANQSYFLLDYGAGAPPDMFSTGGQEWGNPPLDVNNQAAVDYFISRFQFAEKYLDYVRIDHVLGLFRLLIWHKSKGNIITEGFFYPQISSGYDITIYRSDLESIGINPEKYTQFAGLITDIKDLGIDTCKRLIENGFAKYLYGQEKIAWIDDSKADTTTVTQNELALFTHNLNINEDIFKKRLRERFFAENEIELVISARRRLLNMLGKYFNSEDHFFFTFYGKETWQYLNFDNKAAIDNLLQRKRNDSFLFWRQRGKSFLADLQKMTKLKLFAEDLGLVDPYMIDVLQELDIPGIDIIRWSKSFRLEDQRELAVLTTSSHDTSTFATWWYQEVDQELKRRFLREFFSSDFKVDLDNDGIKKVIASFSQAKSKFIIIPFWEILHLWYCEPDIRINKPGIADANNWCMRMDHAIENLSLDLFTGF